MISCIVLTKNEEKNIAKCLKSLTWCDEIIVIDDYSIDQTIDEIYNLQFTIYKEFPKSKIRIFKHKLNNNFAGQRNFGLERAKHEWILYVDADETIPPSLRNEIIQLTGNQSSIVSDTVNQYLGFYIKRRDFWLGKELKHGESGNVKLLRLGRKGTGNWSRKVHEEWRVKGEVGELKNPILHYPHPKISEFVTDINSYSSLHAEENIKAKKKFNFLFVIFHPMGKFFINYFLKLGFLDGTAGFMQAVLMSFHSFLSWSKAWMD